MAKTTTMHTRIEPEIKQKADAILKSLGITTTEAINMFMRQIVIYRGIPFDVRLPNEETMKAIEETEKMAAEGISRFDTVDEMFEALED